MAQTAIISPQIVDSTSIGRDLITAADQAAAQAIIGVTGVDVTADYNWTGNHDFSNTVTVDTVNASGATLDLQLGGSTVLKANSSFSYYYAGGGNTYILQGSDFLRPQGGAAPFDLGGTSHRWRTVFGEKGSFSGNLNSEVGGTQRVYNLGADGDVDTEYLETSWAINVATIETKATGSGAARELSLVNGATSLKLESTLATLIANNNNVIRGSGTSATYLYSHSTGTILEVGDGEFKPFTSTVALGSAANRWSTAYGVDGDFSGTVQAEYVTGVNGTATDANLWFRPDFGHLFIKSGASNVARFAATGNLFYASCSPQTSDLYDLGTSVQRWRSVGSVDGTFSGNLNTEVGGSRRLYRLGAEGDTDTEFLETLYDDTYNHYSIRTGATGSGTTIRSIYIGTGFTGTNSRGLIISNSSCTFSFGGTRLVVKGGTIDSQANFSPSANNLYDLGSDTNRWSNIYSVDGDFSGTTTTAGFATGVQTITAASDTLANTDHTNLCDCTSNAITINLPAASAGQRFEIKKIDSSANAVTIDANGSETIDGALTATLTTQYESITLVSDGSNWFIV